MPWGDRNELWWMDPKYDWSTSVAAASRNFMQAREMAQEQKQFDALLPLKQSALEVDMLNAASRAQEVTSMTEMRRSALQDDLRSKPLFDEWVINIQKTGDLSTPIPAGLAPKWQTQAVHTLSELRRLKATSAEAVAAKEADATRRTIDTQMARRAVDLMTTFPEEYADLPVDVPFSKWDVQSKQRAKVGFSRLTQFKQQQKQELKADPFADDLARAEADLAGLKAIQTPTDEKEKAKHLSKIREAASKVDEWRKKVRPVSNDPLKLFSK